MRATTFKTKSGLVQCYRFHDFGQTDRYCGRIGKCGWCGRDHWTHECPKQTRPKFQQCYGKHPTSFRVCPVRLELLETSKEKRTKKAEKTARTFPAARTRTGFYAAATAHYPEPEPPLYHHTPQPGLDQPYHEPDPDSEQANR